MFFLPVFSVALFDSFFETGDSSSLSESSCTMVFLVGAEGKEGKTTDNDAFAWSGFGENNLFSSSSNSANILIPGALNLLVDVLNKWSSSSELLDEANFCVPFFTFVCFLAVEIISSSLSSLAVDTCFCTHGIVGGVTCCIGGLWLNEESSPSGTFVVEWPLVSLVVFSIFSGFDWDVSVVISDLFFISRSNKIRVT